MGVTDWISLTVAEKEMIEAHRSDAKIKESANNDMRNELENIYHDLLNMNPTYWEEITSDITDRIYRMLY